MKREQEVFIKLVSRSMGNKEIIDIENIDLGEVVDYALEQNLETMILKSVKTEEIKLEDKIKNKLTKASILNNIRMINFINKIEYILEILNKNQIKVVLLKGLVIRDYYSEPLFRTMGDGDILVEQHSVDKVVEILENQGFKELSRCPVHVHMKDKDNFIIEVHSCLIKNNLFKNEEKINEYIWEALEVYKVNNIYKPSKTNFFTHMIIHLAKHKKCKNTSIRGLCDIAVFLKKESNNINWEKYNENIGELGLKKFSNIILIMIEKIFKVHINEHINLDYTQYKEEFIEEIIDEAFKGGVHGKKIGENRINAKFKIGQDKKIFVDKEKLNPKYDYAKRYRILVPVAWIHRILRGIFTTDYTFKEKIRYIFMAKREINEIQSLNNWLGL